MCLLRVIIDEEKIVKIYVQTSNGHGSTNICIYQVQDPLGSTVTARKGTLDILSKSTTSANITMLNMYLWKACYHIPQSGKGFVM
jgi:hypothetical protein